MGMGMTGVLTREILRHQPGRKPGPGDGAPHGDYLLQIVPALGASSGMRVRYGASNAHASSETSDRQGVQGTSPYPPESATGTR